MLLGTHVFNTVPCQCISADPVEALWKKECGLLIRHHSWSKG